jgi:hypothetical protein
MISFIEWSKLQRSETGWLKRSPEEIRAMSLASRLCWQDPVFRAKMIAAAKRGGHSIAMKRQWANPEFRKKRLACTTSITRQKISVSTKRAWANPVLRAQRIQSIKESWAQNRDEHLRRIHNQWRDKVLYVRGSVYVEMHSD